MNHCYGRRLAHVSWGTASKLALARRIVLERREELGDDCRPATVTPPPSDISQS
jgi:hypothetical protein